MTKTPSATKNRQDEVPVEDLLKRLVLTGADIVRIGEDAELLLDLLCNLVQNAVRAAAPGSPVALYCSQSGDAVTLTVTGVVRANPDTRLISSPSQPS